MRDRKIADKYDIFFLAGLFVFSVIAFVRCRFGMATVDEPFFLTMGDKFYHGQAMITQEWHASQFGFFLIQPLFALFHLFHKTNEGIVLFFRHTYVILQAAVSLFLYFRLWKFPAPIREDERYRKLTYITYHFWIFLEDWDVVMCAPSEWLSGLHNYSEENPNSFVIGRLELFYSRNPERVPDAVFVGSGYEDIRDWYIAQYGLQIQDEGQYGTILVRKEV